MGKDRIVGGEDAEPGEFPHQVALLIVDPGHQFHCGGTLITPSIVLTAGHCCHGQDISHLAVRVGEYNLLETDPGQEDIPVHSVLVHENYTYIPGDQETVYNDICLVELEYSADLDSPGVGVLALPYQGEEYIPGTACTVIGWGATQQRGYLSMVLQKGALYKVTVPVVSDPVCRDAYGPSVIPDSVLCAGQDEGGADACQGDSGGPIMCGDQVSGIVSTGRGCARPGFPGIYTQTSYFTDWITDNLEKLVGENQES